MNDLDPLSVPPQGSTSSAHDRQFDYTICNINHGHDTSSIGSTNNFTNPNGNSGVLPYGNQLLNGKHTNNINVSQQQLVSMSSHITFDRLRDYFAALGACKYTAFIEMHQLNEIFSKEI